MARHVAVFRRLRELGDPLAARRGVVRQLAQEFGVHPSTISRSVAVLRLELALPALMARVSAELDTGPVLTDATHAHLERFARLVRRHRPRDDGAAWGTEDGDAGDGGELVSDEEVARLLEQLAAEDAAVVVVPATEEEDLARLLTAIGVDPAALGLTVGEGS